MRSDSFAIRLNVMSDFGDKGRPAVFLDRDGTLNRLFVREGKPFSPMMVEEFELFEDVPATCARLAAAGFVLVVATNQPDVGRGRQSQAVIEAMHGKLQALIPQITRIEVCYAPGLDETAPPNRRRKPEPGMLIDAARVLDLDLSRSWMIGDRWRDVDCGRRAGTRTIFINFGYMGEPDARPDFTVKSLSEAAGIILGQPPEARTRSFNPTTP